MGEETETGQSWEYRLRKYLLLLATLVVTVTYAAGFNPPGGVWQDTRDGQLAGDPIIRATHYHWFLAFYYCNATAFAASLVVIVLILVLAISHDKKIKKEEEKKVLWPLRVFMGLDVLSLMSAYGAGTYRDVVTVVLYCTVSVGTVLVYVVCIIIMQGLSCFPDEHPGSGSGPGPGRAKGKERHCKILMLLATFAVSVTYVAGLSTPGGFWDSTGGSHHPGDPILRDRHDLRLTVFLFCNTTAFVASLFITMQLIIDSKLHEEPEVGLPRKYALYACIIIALIGLVSAYIAGSCRDTRTTVSVIITLVAAFILLAVLLKCRSSPAPQNGENQRTDNASVRARQHGTKDGDGVAGMTEGPTIQVAAAGVLAGAGEEAGVGWIARDTSGPAKEVALTVRANLAESKKKSMRLDYSRSQKIAKNQQTDNVSECNAREAVDKARSLVLLLASLAATISYTAGLDPPGGLWQDNSDGHMAGDPILLTMNAGRYKAFFYCNSAALVTSLVAIILVQNDLLLKHHVLEVAMILVLFGLMGAYAAGSCRDVDTSIYAMALAGVVLIYVVIHVVIFTLDHKDKQGDEELLEKRRKRLLLFAILAATITYQAGLTPPGGFLLRDDEFGHHAGDPILLHNFPRRYNAFFYCNTVSFMLSIALIILLVNPNLYRPAVRSNALSVCAAVGLFGLLAGYAAGSTQHITTSIYIFVLVAVVLGVAVILLAVFWGTELERNGNSAAELERNGISIGQEEEEQENTAAPSEPQGNGISIGQEDEEQESSAAPSEPQRNGISIGQEEEQESSAAPSEPQRNDVSIDEKKEKTKHAKRKYLMLLGILVASVTYQAGLKPPGGAWQSSGNGYEAGNPVMRDNRTPQYLTFFYSNSISFMASILVIIMLLRHWLIDKDIMLLWHCLIYKEVEEEEDTRNKQKEEEEEEEEKEWSLRVMKITTVVNFLALLVAYAVGSSRDWKTSLYVGVFSVGLQGYLAIIMFCLSCHRHLRKKPSSQGNSRV